MPKSTTQTSDNESKSTSTATTTTNEAREESKYYTKGPVKPSSRPQSPAPHILTQHRDSNNNTMSTTSARSAAGASEMTYYLVPNLQALDPSACEMDASTHAWVQPTIIDDDDLTFGGKSLSAWYEEDRRRLSHSDGEESRGRERTRRSHSSRGSRK